MISRRLLLAAALAALALPAHAEEPPIFAVSGLALQGYDPVAYFTEGKPVEGKPDIALMWMGATWHFASKANRDAFERMPQKYAPQYGGYCAWAIADGNYAKGSAKHWAIVDGKLYLNYNKSIQKKWNKDRPGFIKRGDAQWTELQGE